MRSTCLAGACPYTYTYTNTGHPSKPILCGQDVDNPPLCLVCGTAAFELYDFNGLGSLTCDELALALQSTATGLCKITG
jgi:hypothetical protein